jgi:hypothetical protein
MRITHSRVTSTHQAPISLTLPIAAQQPMQVHAGQPRTVTHHSVIIELCDGVGCALQD